MKYYAVTNDPAELMHYGIKGMKWGVIRTDAQLGHPKSTRKMVRKKPKSEAYKKASSKLSNAMKNGIDKVKTSWKEYHSPQAKEERFMKKAMQEARNGTLKYGKLSDSQVKRITQRLALEQDARRLGSTEPPKFSKRLKISIGEGIVKGVGMGTMSYIDARMRGRGQTTAQIKADKRMAKYASNKRVMKRKAKNEVDKEYYRQMAENGNADNVVKRGLRITAGTAGTGLQAIAELAAGNDDYARELMRGRMAENRKVASHVTARGRARYIASQKKEQERNERIKNQQKVRDNAYYTTLGKAQASAVPGLPPPPSPISVLPAPRKSPSAPVPAPSGGRTSPIVTSHKPRRDRNNRPSMRNIEGSYSGSAPSITPHRKSSPRRR